MPMTDPPPRYWVRMRTVPEMKTKNAGVMFTGGMDFMFDVMEGDTQLKSFRASYYGGQRYAESQANAEVGRLEAAARREAELARQAKAARYKKLADEEEKLLAGGTGMSATDEARTRYETALTELANVIGSLNSAHTDLESIQSSIQGELEASSSSDAPAALGLLQESIEQVEGVNVQLVQFQEQLEAVMASI